MSQKTWDDYIVGQKMTTTAITVTETHIVNFAGITGEHSPLHMDEEYAKNTVFGTRIVQGPLTFCLGTALVSSSGFFGDSIIAFAGADNLRFQAPVIAGDTIHTEVEVLEKKETSKPSVGTICIKYMVKNQRDETVSLVEITFLMHR